MKMNAEQELLNFVYQNSEMGAISIKKITSLTEDEPFLEQLRKERAEYLSINAAAKSALLNSGCDEKGLSAMEKLRTYLAIDIQSLTDKSTPHLAEMMVIGSTMGIIDAKKNLRKYKDAAGDARGLIDTLCDFETRNVDILKSFL